MKKSRFIFLVSLFVLATGAYVAFALRAFYLRPEIQWDPSTPGAARITISKYFEEIGGFPTADMTWKGVQEAIIHPASSVKPATLRLVSDDEIWVGHQGRLFLFLRNPATREWHMDGLFKNLQKQAPPPKKQP